MLTKERLAEMQSGLRVAALTAATALKPIPRARDPLGRTRHDPRTDETRAPRKRVHKNLRSPPTLFSPDNTQNTRPVLAARSAEREVRAGPC